MHPLEDFLWGPLCKPSLEVQARAAFMSLYETYEPDFHARTIKSLDEDEHLQYLRTMVCLKIASVLPDECNDRKQEMWLIQASGRHEIPVFCSQNEWKQVQQSCEHAKGCGWATFMAQKAQDAHERRHFQLADQTSPDHFVRVLREQEYHQLPRAEQQLASRRDHQAHRTDEVR